MQMNKEILINAGAGEIRIALVEDGRLQELFLERTIGREDGTPRRREPGSHRQSVIGNIILGRVQRVLPGMQAAFVDVGLERSGFLGAREARSLAELSHLGCQSVVADDRAPTISDCVREGEEILVQVVKDPIGEKGARLSANITIPGRLLVFVPCQPGIALSRRIEDENERLRLLALGEAVLKENEGQLVPGGGYILRAAAIGAELADLLEDAERLSETWRPVLARRQTAVAPATLYHDLDAVERTMRDEVDASTSRILIDDAAALAAASAYCRRAMPDAESKIALFTGPGMLFDLYGLEDEIERLSDPRVPLASGGWITIESTEALTAIDVNSGSYTAATGLEETSLAVNLEAATEIGRQLCLRGIGGLIVIDFIHLNEAANIARVLDALKASCAKDRTPTQISAMSEFGLVEITRKRIREPLFKLMTEFCRPCRGHGRTRTADSVAFDVLRGIERSAKAAPGKPVLVRAAPEIVRWFNAHCEEVRANLVRRGAGRVQFEAREEFARDGFDVTTLP